MLLIPYDLTLFHELKFSFISNFELMIYYTKWIVVLPLQIFGIQTNLLLQNLAFKVERFAYLC